jgi:hypothetical protein
MAQWIELQNAIKAISVCKELEDIKIIRNHYKNDMRIRMCFLETMLNSIGAKLNVDVYKS